MNIQERGELAADIAKRVRLYSWNPMPKELAAILGPHAMTWQQQMPFITGPNYGVLRMNYYPGSDYDSKRLELDFNCNNMSVGRLLWTPD